MVTGTLALLIGAAMALAAWSTFDLMFSEERRVARRLRDLSDLERHSAADVEPLSRPFAQRVVHPFGAALVRRLHDAAPRGYRDTLQQRCRTAGFPSGLDGDSLIVIKVVATLTVGAIVSLLAVVMDADLTRGLLGAAALAALTWFAPDVWLSGRVRARQDALRRELPDMLDMLLIAVEAGLGFDAAVTKYVRNRGGPLSEEFAVALREIQAGMSRREALRGVADRCDTFELSAFVMAMVQADVFGVSIGSVLRTQAREIRVKRRQRAEEIAQKAPAKMVFPLVLCILPATLIVLMTPAVIGIGRAFGLID
jgi:tight adherence protein C